MVAATLSWWGWWSRLVSAVSSRLINICARDHDMLPKLVRSQSRLLSYAVVLAISATVISCGGGDSSGPSIPASISIDKGFSAIAPAGTELSPPIAVRDRHGNGLPNVEVTLAVA